MRSWVFRNRRRLESIYGVPGRPRPLTEPSRLPPGEAGGRPNPRRLVIYALIPLPRRVLRPAG